MASPKTPNHNHTPFDIHNFFPPPPYPTHHPPSYPPPTAVSSASSFFPYPSLPPPPLNANAGPQILALINNSSNNAINNSNNTLTITNNSPTASCGSCSNTAKKGRRVSGDYVVYDVDAVERDPQQLEVNPITKYGSDPELVIGRQIAVNKYYICYGLKAGNVRVLNLNTASRSLFRGHTKRVTDMVFFADDVHLLASVSVEGRVFAWRIREGPDEEDKPQITGDVVVAIQFVGGRDGEGDYVHPRLCWHCNRQDVLVAGIGKCLLRIDTTKIGQAEVLSAEAPIRCSVDALIDGVQLVGKHEGDITDLSMCKLATTCLVSASADGTVKIWEDGKAVPLIVLKPHGGHPVNSATFMTAPHQAGHIVLVTAGPLNQEVKIWASTSEEGWLLPSHAKSWKCTQTLEFKSSAQPQVEEAFFNQVVALSRAGLLLIANAKKNSVYAVHLEYGANPASTRMDYIAEFKVTLPILSFTGTTNPPGEHSAKLYCVQTLAIQQYSLDLCQCLPLPLESGGIEKSDSSVLHDASNAEGFAALDLNGSRHSGFPFSSSASKPTIQVGSSDTATAVRYPVRSASLEALDSREFMTSNIETKPTSLARTTSDADTVCVASPPLPLSPGLSRKISGFRNPTNSSELGPFLSEHGGSQPVIDYSVNRQTETNRANLSDAPSLENDAKNNSKKVALNDVSRVHNHPIVFKHPTHLITPSEILMSVSSSETTHIFECKNKEEVNVQDVVVNSDVGNAEVEVKEVGEILTHNDEFGSQVETQTLVSGNREKYFCSQALGLGIDMARDCCDISAENYDVDGAPEVDGVSVMERFDEERFTPHHNGEEKAHDSKRDVDGKALESAMTTAFPQSGAPSVKGRNQKERNSQTVGQSSTSSGVLNSANSFGERGGNSSLPSTGAAFSQIMAMQDMLNQLMTMQKELQKQMSSLVNLPVTKEGRRLEAALGRSIEKAVKANNDTLWARFQEENAKNERLLRDRTHQMTSLVTNLVNKDLTPLVEKTVKKELAAVGPAIARTINPSIEKTICLAIAESFQRGVGDKAVNHLERSVNSRLEATVGRQIQAQFQTSGKQALQDALKSNLEASVIPAFDKSCRAMFEQVNATFQRGMVEHTTAAQQHFESAHSSLAHALRDSISSASSIAQSLSAELADGQRKLLSLANTSAVNPLVPQLSNGSLCGLHEQVEVPLDPTRELSRLISEGKYEEAFTASLQRSDVSTVSWLCAQVDLHGLLSLVPVPLSQGVLLSLLQQLSCDINKDSTRKLAWITDIAAAINPSDPMISVHVRPIFQQVYHRLNHQRSLPTITGAELSSIRLPMHVINSMLTTFK